MADNKKWSRRDFMKIAGATGVGAVVSPIEHLAHTACAGDTVDAKIQIVPKRPFGKTGVDVSILTLGGSMSFTSRQLLLRQAFKMGVTCWDTSSGYIGGRSEKGIGMYLGKYPEHRKKIFLITKANGSDPDDMTQDLHRSLQRMQTSYIDLYLVQSVSDVKKELNKDIRAWADKFKGKGMIRFFGFATHKNMEKCLFDGAQLGWIEGILTTYNYRVMHRERMKKAVDACTKAGIGLIAMKTQAALLGNLVSDVGRETETARNLKQRFIDKGFTKEQAKLISVWENPLISSICSHMPNMTILQENVEVALKKTSLTQEDKQLLEQYSKETTYAYCTGCAQICETAIKDKVPISDVMRYLMYYSSYKDKQKAFELFNQLPLETRRCITQVDYSKAEKCCPQNIPIAQLMRKAVERLAC